MTPAEKTLRRESLFLRVLWMLLFFLVWQVAVPLLAILIVAQFLYRLFYGAPSQHFMSFGDSLSQYLSQIGRYAVFNTDEKPWPVADWPRARQANGERAYVPNVKEPTSEEASAAAAATSPVVVTAMTSEEVAEERKQILDEEAIAESKLPENAQSSESVTSQADLATEQQVEVTAEVLAKTKAQENMSKDEPKI